MAITGPVVVRYRWHKMASASSRTSDRTARFVTQIGRTTTRKGVERHPAALSQQGGFFWF
jgi:hypothetical protein